MDLDEIVDVLNGAGRVLERRGIRGEIYRVGDAVIALAYDSRRSTRDNRQ